MSLYYTLNEVILRTKLTGSKITKLSKDPSSDFPKPTKLTKRLNGWLRTDIDNWVKDNAN